MLPNSCRASAETRPAMDERSQRLFSSPPPIYFSPTVIPPRRHTVLRTTWPGEGYLPLSDKDSATADISRPRHLGHNSGVNVCRVCLMQPSWSWRRIVSAGSPDMDAFTGDRGCNESGVRGEQGLQIIGFDLKSASGTGRQNLPNSRHNRHACWIKSSTNCSAY